MRKLILIGDGGHSKVIKDIVAEMKEIELFAILDDSYNSIIERNGVIYSNTRYLESINKKDYVYCLAIGSNNIRKRLYNKFNIPINYYVTLIHPSAVISRSATIGHGTVVMPNAVINADAEIGNHCIINTGSIIEHDNKLADYVHISPNATLSGTVSVGEGTHIGSAAVVVPGKKIGSWSIIGAGTVIIDDIEDKVTAVGVPGKVI